MSNRTRLPTEQPQGEGRMTELLHRIESALSRGEAAAERLDRRHRTLRLAARETVAGLDQMIATERHRAHG